MPFRFNVTKHAVCFNHTLIYISKTYRGLNSYCPVSVCWTTPTVFNKPHECLLILVFFSFLPAIFNFFF